MAKNTYAIMGATGHIGQVVVEELVEKRASSTCIRPRSGKARCSSR